MKFLAKSTDNKTKLRQRRILLQGTSIGLCVAMSLSIAGCGRSSTDPVKTIAADSAYFSVEDLDFYKQAEGEESNLVTVIPVKDKIAMLINVYNYSNSTTDTVTAEAAKLASSSGDPVETVAAAAETAAKETASATTTETSADTTDTTAAPDTSSSGDGTEIPQETQDPNAGTAPQTKYIVLFYDNQGKLLSQADLTSTFGPNDYVMNMTGNADGNLIVMAQTYDQVTYEATFLLYTFDTEGKQIGEPVVLPFDQTTSPNQMTMDGEGNMYFTGYGEKGMSITVLDKDAKPLFDITQGTESLNGTIYLIDGKMYADGYDYTNEVYKYLFYPIDTAAKALGEPIDMTDIASMGGSGFYVGTDSLFYSNSIGVYSVDMETKTKTSVLLWKDTDIESSMNGNQRVVVFSADKIMIMNTTYDQTGTQTKVSLLNREAKNPNAGKKIITIAGVNITYDSAVLSAVYSFNTTNSDYRIEIHDYMADQVITTNEEYNKVINTMNMEILSGDGPDIIYGSFQSFDAFEAKGLLVDLYSLMEKDTSFKKEDYAPSIFKLCEDNGKLYKIGTSFSIQGYVGAKSVIGDRMGWTVDEFNEMVSSLPEGVKPLANQTQTTLLTSSLYASMDAFVNNTKSEVTFDTPAFYQLLDYAKTYGTDDDIKDGEYVDEQTMLQNGELAMASCYISDPTSYAQYVSMVGGPVSVTGFPSSDKRGPMCYMSTMLAINSESGSQKAAWDFVKSFLSEDAQNKLAKNYQIPVLTSAFEAQITSAMNPDENNGGMIVYDKMGQATPMTEETAQAYRDLVNGLNTLASYDQEIIDIILEEVPEYFNDQKTDKAVAALVQDRVQTLVNERQ